MVVTLILMDVNYNSFSGQKSGKSYNVDERVTLGIMIVILETGFI